MTFVRGNPERVNRKEVISEAEFAEMLREAEALPETFYRLRTLALLCILRLTGKRRSEVARLELSDFKIEKGFLHVTFTLSKKRRQNLITKRSQKSIPLILKAALKHHMDFTQYFQLLLPTEKFTCTAMNTPPTLHSTRVQEYAVLTLLLAKKCGLCWDGQA